MGYTLQIGRGALLRMRTETEGPGDVRAARELEEFRGQMQQANALLASFDLPAHAEPEELAETQIVRGLELYGYTGLHALRRLAARLALNLDDGALPAPVDLDAVAEERRSLDLFTDRFSDGEDLPFAHTILHSDAEGFYVPVDFSDPLFDESIPLAGEILGASLRLQNECAELARRIGLSLAPSPDAPELTDADLLEALELQESGANVALAQRLEKPWLAYAWESHTLLALHAAARASLQSGAVIAFV